MNRNLFLGIVFFLFVISTMVSQSAMDGFFVLSCITLMSFWLLDRRQFTLLPKTGLEIPFAFFSVAVLLSFLANWEHQTLAVSRIVELKWILSFYFVTSLFVYVNPNWRDFQRVEIFVLISTVFGLLGPVLGYDLLLGPSAQIERTSSGFMRIGGFFSNPMTFAHLHAVIFFLLAGVSFHLLKAEKGKAWKTVALTGLLGVCLLLTFTRGVWIGAFVGLVFLGFVFNRRWGYLVLVGSTLAGLFSFVAIPAVQERALQFLNPQSYDGERVWIWKSNWQMFLDNPFFGLGYGQNTLALPEYYERLGAPANLLVSHSHNQYLHMMAGLGLVGIVAYLTLILSVFVITWKLYQRVKKSSLPSWQQGLVLGSLAAQVSFWVGGLTECHFEHSKVRYVLMIAWAVPLWIRHLLQQSEKSVSRGEGVS